MKYFFFIILFLFVFIRSYSQVQVDDSIRINYRNFSLSLNKPDSVINLPSKFIVHNSVILYIDSNYISPAFYDIDHRFGKIKFKNVLVSQIFSVTLDHHPYIEIFYKSYPYDFPDSYSKFEILTQIDTVSSDTVAIAEIKPDFIEDIFAGSDLQKSGNIFRGFTVGNNRDFTLNSGFRLQLNGQLSEDIDITAALTDENTPIQPEGNTQKLQELDKVFIELRSKNVTATLGDIDVNYSGLNFFNFNRKVQGAKGIGQFSFSDIVLNAALSRGRFSSNSFNGIDGVQGPYRLIGADNEVNIIVIGGSERVYLNGVLMVRGETNDYVIDYSIGQITFTAFRLITSASRIVVDFEYSDKKYSRNLLSGQVKIPVVKNKFNVTLSYMRESDDRNKPVDFILSENDRIRMSEAGDDLFKASKSGVTYVGYDSLGRPLGLYAAADTLIEGQSYRYYRYQPNQESSVYQVSFSFVGSGKGDYNSLSTTSYRFVGPGRGSYLPIVLLPLPVMYQSADINFDYKAGKNFSFNLETAVSDFDKNLFSGSDDTENKGLALISSATYKNDKLNIGRQPGLFEFTLRQKYINKLYNNADRLNQVEYNRVWDIRDSTNKTELVTEGEFNFLPVNFLYVRGVGGHIKRGDTFNSQRGNLALNFRGDSLNAPSLLYNFDYIASRESSIDYKGIWFRQNGYLDYYLFKNLKTFGSLRLFVDFNGEDKKIKSLNTDVLSDGSYRYYELAPGFTLSDILNLDLSYRIFYRRDDVFNQSFLSRQSNSLTHNFTLGVNKLSFMSSAVNLTVYNKKYSPEFFSAGFTDAKSILLDSRLNFYLFNNALQTSMFYKVSNERTPTLEVIFLKVPQGQGNYIYLGDLNQNGFQDENEFQLVNFDGDYIKIVTPTEQTFPTTSVQTSMTFSVNPGRYFESIKGSFLDAFLNGMNLETYIAIDEKSRDPEQSNIYLLKLSHFQNDVNTLNGVNIFRQDINLFENYEYAGIRLRFNQRKGFTQYFTGNERTLYIERSARLNLSFTPDLIFVNEYINESDRNNAPLGSFRNRNIGINSYVSDLTYEPFKNVQVGFTLKVSRAMETYQLPNVQSDQNDQILRFNYGLGNKGKVRLEVERSEVILNNQPFFLPYELTKGKPVGKSFFWTLGLDYRITDFIQATVNYFGRAEGNSRVIHTGTAEFRAFF